ncbi:hypothetical protein GCM10028816_53010 [Spirosoma lituiforme]
MIWLQGILFTQVSQLGIAGIDSGLGLENSEGLISGFGNILIITGAHLNSSQLLREKKIRVTTVRLVVTANRRLAVMT